MALWHRLLISAVVVLFAVALAGLLDRRIARRELAPEARTRYRILRRSIVSAVVAVGVLSALLVIPPVRAVAGGLLASSAVVGLVVGFAAQSTLSNFVAGIVIAFTQPLRLGDRVELESTEGTVEEIGLTYTFIRTAEGVRLVIPNSKLASDTIRNSTIVSREKVAEITVQVPLASDLHAAVDGLRDEFSAEPGAHVFVSGLDGGATLTVRVPAADAAAAERLEHELRLRAHAHLRSTGVLG